MAEPLTPPYEALDAALYQAGLSPCLSKRGAVVLDPDRDGWVISQGHNHQPTPFKCTGDKACKATCGKTAVHAEQMALLGLGDYVGFSDHDLLHVKTVDGLLVASGPPSCLECSKLILAAGIANVWLFHETGWQRYEAEEFHRLTLQHQQIEVPR